MAIDIRLPNITAKTEREQLMQVKSYLYQLAEQLQFTLNNMESPQQNATMVIASGGQAQATQYVMGRSSAPIDEQDTFDAVKGLIIKSADIIEAYYNEIATRLSGAYVAESDFGTYSEQTEQVITANSKEIESVYSNIQTILTNIESLEYRLLETKAHIRSGLLYTDGSTPVYGLEIGQKNMVDGEEVFNKYARFTAGRLSFFDQNDTEVAYISDYKLYIRNVEITYRHKIGGLVDTVMSTGDVVTKWVGGD